MSSVIVSMPIRRTVDESYSIVIGRDLVPVIADRLGEADLARLGLVIITDDSVRPLLAGSLRAELLARGRSCALISFSPGEKSKTRQTKAEIEDAMIESGLGRDTCVVAVGGGVVTDLAGFVAGTFARGVPFVNCPTTLLAAADASVGGKTGVDTPAATNLIGVFHQPVAVFIDLGAWSTLPAAEIRNGLAETVKHGCLGDLELFEALEQFFVVREGTVDDLVNDEDLCQRIAVANCEIKKRFVVADVQEANLRMVLNLGHTFGRALEAADAYRISHGEAVSVGLCLQAELGRRRGLVTRGEVDRITALLARIGLPTRLPAHIDDNLLVTKMLRDKKVRQGQVRFVFQKGIGGYAGFADGSVSVTIPLEEIHGFLHEVRG